MRTIEIKCSKMEAKTWNDLAYTLGIYDRSPFLRMASLHRGLLRLEPLPKIDARVSFDVEEHHYKIISNRAFHAGQSISRYVRLKAATFLEDIS